MLTIMFYITVREGQEETFDAMARRLTRLTRESDEGMVTYRFHRRQDDRREYLLYEQWKDMPSLSAHLAHLAEELGPPDPGENLPASLLALCESTRAVMYDVIEQ